MNNLVPEDVGYFYVMSLIAPLTYDTDIDWSIYIMERYVLNLALKLQNADFTYFEQRVVCKNIFVYFAKYAAKESDILRGHYVRVHYTMVIGSE